MDAKSEIREFLTSRRARITPEQAGLPWYGENRRVPGLRREEVALLAGVSVDYYTRLERGNVSGVSETVLEALARALQLDDVERAHLFSLVRAQNASAPPRRRRAARQKIRPSVRLMLDAMTGAPGFVRNDRLDLLAANRLGRALYSQHFDSPHGPANTARFAFLDPRAQSFYLEWERVAHDIVALLHATAGRSPHDRELSELVGQLSMQSETFRTLWAAHDVWRHDTGTKRLHHPLVGDLSLTYESLEVAADPGLTMFVYTAEPGTKSEEALRLLGSWAATADEEELHADHAEQHRDHTRAG
ncbi:MAG TPA: helix-turn-helix transcriptional regulator [Gaiellaceae bacterium]|nr:helix-turn-helix transcriptional regulator [Gaiellaceae bacterium]